MQADAFIAATEERRAAKTCARCKRKHHNEGWYCDVCLGKQAEVSDSDLLKRVDRVAKKMLDTPPRPRAAAEKGEIVPTSFNGVSNEFTCTLCTPPKDCKNAAGLGSHKWRTHGIRGSASSAARGIAHRKKTGGYQPTTNPTPKNPPQGKEPDAIRVAFTHPGDGSARLVADPPAPPQSGDVEIPDQGVAEIRLELIRAYTGWAISLLASGEGSNITTVGCLLVRIQELASGGSIA